MRDSAPRRDTTQSASGSVSSRADDFAAIAGDVAALLTRAEKARGPAARRYALAVLETGLAWSDPGTLDERARARARALGVPDAVLATTERSAPLHAVRIPLVDASSGRALVRTFFASFDAAPTATPHDGGSAHALRDAFELARRHARDPRVRPIRWVAAQPRALERIEIAGDSLGAGALVSAYALLTGAKVRPALAVTGAVRGERVGEVASVEAKIAAARAAGVRRIIVPRGHKATRRGALEIVPVGTIEELLGAAIEPGGGLDARALVTEALEQARRGWRGFRWPEARELLERAFASVPEGELDTRIELLARLGAAERHAGSLGRSEALLEHACTLAEGDEALASVPDDVRSRAYQQRAMTALRLAHTSAARRLAWTGLKTAIRARSRREHIKALGVVGLVEEARGALDAAVTALEKALVLDQRQSPGELARSRAYLAAALARAGREAEARRQYEAALAEATERRSRSDEAWVRTAYGGGLVAIERWAEAREVLDSPIIADAIARDPQPGLGARRHLGRALLRAERSSDRARGLGLLEGAMDAHGPMLEPSLLRVAALSVLHAALAQDGPLPTRASAGALRAFTEGPLGDAAASVLETTGQGHRARLARFVARAERVA